jgi:hypothetical protein
MKLSSWTRLLKVRSYARAARRSGGLDQADRRTRHAGSGVEVKENDFFAGQLNTHWSKEEDDHSIGIRRR